MQGGSARIGPRRGSGVGVQVYAVRVSRRARMAREHSEGIAVGIRCAVAGRGMGEADEIASGLRSQPPATTHSVLIVFRIVLGS